MMYSALSNSDWRPLTGPAQIAKGVDDVIAIPLRKLDLAFFLALARDL